MARFGAVGWRQDASPNVIRWGDRDTILCRANLRKTTDRALKVIPRLPIVALPEGFSQIKMIATQKPLQHLGPARAILIIGNDGELFPDRCVIAIERPRLSSKDRHIHVQKQRAVRRQF